MRECESRFVTGIYKQELKNRFLCEVYICNECEICYVPSSCHISNFLQLEGKKVLLIPTRTAQSKTRFSLFAVPYKRSYIILNTSMANRAVQNSIKAKSFAYLGKRDKALKEHTVEGYKTDLFLPETKTIIEIKSIISARESADFPTVYSERTINQLRAICSMLHKDYKVYFIIVSLHPYLENIKIDKNTKFYYEMIKCMNAGLKLKAYTCRLYSDEVRINKEIGVIY